jgi:hypothetical protein
MGMAGWWIYIQGNFTPGATTVSQNAVLFTS